MQPTEGHGRADQQRAGHEAAAFGHVRRRGVHFAENASRPLKKRRAVLRQAETSGRSAQQRAAKRAFEFDQALAHHRFRQAEATGRLADRAALDNGDEGHDPVRADHCSLLPESSSVICTLRRTNVRFHLGSVTPVGSA